MVLNFNSVCTLGCVYIICLKIREYKKKGTRALLVTGLVVIDIPGVKVHMNSIWPDFQISGFYSPLPTFSA